MAGGDADDTDLLVIGALYPVAIGQCSDGILDIDLASFGKDNIHDIFKLGDTCFHELVVDVTASTVIGQKGSLGDLADDNGDFIRSIGDHV